MSTLAAAFGPEPPKGVPTGTLGLQVGYYPGTSLVDDVLRSVKDGSDTVIGAKALGLLWGLRGNQGAVTPVHIDPPPGEGGALIGAPPGSFRRQVKVALANRFPIRITAALEVEAVLTHRHSASVLQMGRRKGNPDA